MLFELAKGVWLEVSRKTNLGKCIGFKPLRPSIVNIIFFNVSNLLPRSLSRFKSATNYKFSIRVTEPSFLALVLEFS